MRDSEIFSNFVKIAQEQGLISKDSKGKTALAEAGKYDKEEVSNIEALYGVKPDAPKEMEYERNIMEVAHPNSLVIAPSYDKLNGLVENNIERQNILLHIVNKPVNGHLTNHKYAKDDLIKTLVRVGNTMDTKEEITLCSLADHCLNQVAQTTTFKKTAWIPVAVGVAAILGGIYLKNHVRFISDGLQADHQKLMAELDDLLTSNSDWGVGSSYKTQFIATIQDFKGKLQHFGSTFNQIEAIINDIEQLRDAKELMEWAKQPKTYDIQKAIEVFRSSVDFLLPEIQKIIKNFSDEGYKQRQTQDKGWMSSLVDATQVLHGGKGLVADDFDDVRHALETYLVDIQNIRKILVEAGSIQQQVAAEMQSATTKSNEMFGSNTPSEQPATPSKSVSEIDEGADDLSKALLNFGV